MNILPESLDFNSRAYAVVIPISISMKWCHKNLRVIFIEHTETNRVGDILNSGINVATCSHCKLSLGLFRESILVNMTIDLITKINSMLLKFIFQEQFPTKIRKAKDESKDVNSGQTSPDEYSYSQVSYLSSFGR